jgi:hypothetical protein
MKLDNVDTSRKSAIKEHLSANGWTEAQVATALGHLEVTYFRESEYENADNLRLARTGNEAEYADYLATQADGCCGSHDERRFTPDGEIAIGFNYGH